MKLTPPRGSTRELLGSEGWFRALVEDSSDGIALIDREGRITYESPSATGILGYTPEERLGQSALEMIHPDDVDTARQAFLDCAALPGARVVAEFRARHRDHSWRFLEAIGVNHFEDPLVGALVATYRDITERKLAERRLRESEERYRSLFESNPSPMFLYDVQTLRFLAVNDAAVDNYGYSREEFLAMTIREIRPPEDVPLLLHRLKSLPPGRHRDGPFRHRRKDGTIFDVETFADTISLEGWIARVVLVNDITEQKRGAEALAKSEERYRRFFEEDLAGVVITTPEGALVDCNLAFARILGFADVDQAKAHDLRTFYLDAENRELLLERVNKERQAEIYEVEARSRDGLRINLTVKAVGSFDENGELRELKSYLFDVTERKKLEEQLRQSQKIEAVGRLAGGIAHDFNNLLTAILGYSSLMLKRMGERDPLRRNLLEIRKAGDRAASLTHQLLAFSRKQVLLPEILDLNTVVSGLDGMLRRLIGEDIDLVTILHPGLGKVRADPGQMEQVIVNLAVNARDAMPLGGKLTIEAQNIILDDSFVHEHVGAQPGPYVILSVRDTGAGMDRETREHIFEPFFTTKGPGKGTGLGLATVYGIVKQSGGYIAVSSEPGRGTSFEVYLPRVPAGDEASLRSPQDLRVKHGSETVLLVEDEDTVRGLARTILEDCGYRVLVATRGAEALRIAESHLGPIHLMLTDVVMPGMSGSELAERLCPSYPGMRLLYMSGYTDEAILPHGVLEPGGAFLQKPFTPEALAGKVREVLDR